MALATGLTPAAAAAAGGARTTAAAIQAMAGERRTVGQALSYWHAIRGHRSLPTLDDVDLAECGPLTDKLFILDIREGIPEAPFTHCGGSLSTAFGRKVAGKRPHDLMPADVADHLLDLVRAVADFRRPLADAATMPRVRGGGVLKHRMAVMPLAGADGRTVTHILGAFSYRID